MLLECLNWRIVPLSASMRSCKLMNTTLPSSLCSIHPECLISSTETVLFSHFCVVSSGVNEDKGYQDQTIKDNTCSVGPHLVDTSELRFSRESKGPWSWDTSSTITLMLMIHDIIQLPRTLNCRIYATTYTWLIAYMKHLPIGGNWWWGDIT
jgi:hypothetical protein